MASVAASSTTMHPHPSSVSYAESPESGFAGTNGTECGVTGFPIGFGGWTAAKMYERNVNNNNDQRRTASETASTARQEVGLSGGFCFCLYLKSSYLQHVM